LGKIRFHLGMVARKIGDSHVALEQFDLFLSELPSKYPELALGEGKAYFYQALTLRERRELAGAVGAYQNAITCCERDGLPSLRCMCLQNLAWLYCHLQDAQNARRCLTESSTLIVTSEDHVHQSLGEAFLALLDKQYGIAAELCESIFRRTERGESVALEEQAQAAWLAGSVALEHDNLESANALAEVSLSFATEAKDSRLMNDANALRRTIYVRRQAGA
jgi:tetratricopeptide (TPR) repeat protein